MGEYLAAFGGAIIANAPYLVGFIMPPFVELLNKDVKAENERYLVALVACFGAAVILHWHSIAYGTPQDAVTYFGIIFVECNALFKLYFANSWLRGKMQDSFLNSQSEVLPTAPIPPVEPATP